MPVPDNPHPHNPAFNQTVQLFLIRLYQIVQQDVTSLNRAKTATTAARGYTTTFFARTPRS